MKWKGHNNSFNSWIDKKRSYKMSSEYFPSHKGDTIDINLNLSNYATKDDLKNITPINVSGFALETNLTSLKTEIDKIDADKLKNVPADLTRLNNVVKNDGVKKTEYSTLKTKVDNIDITNFAK